MLFIKSCVENGYDKINDMSTHEILINTLKRYRDQSTRSLLDMLK